MKKEISVTVEIPILIWESKEEKCWYAECPSLRVYTFGDSESNAVAMGKEAIQGWIESMHKNQKGA